MFCDTPCICITIALNTTPMTITMMKRMEWIMINAGNDDDLLELCCVVRRSMYLYCNIVIALDGITMTITMMRGVEWIMISKGNDDDLLELCYCCKTLHVFAL